MRAKFIAIMAMSGLVSVAQAQIPVTDAILNGQTTTHNAAMVLQWAKEIAEMKQQFTELQRHWDKMDKMESLVTGSRNLGISNVPGINGELPSQISSVYSGSYGDTQSIMQAERVTQTNASAQAALQERQFQSAATEKALALRTFEGAQNRLNNINSLINKIAASNDPKAIQDLNARISAEQAILQNETQKLQTVSQLAKAEDKLIDERRKQMNRSILSSSNTSMPGIK
ncbi:type IV secretion system protein [Pseudomonas protegens]|uniref:type IV secretion system protein n=1 Tax=Pseudomonas protegens TaxID=380021 RepID=UPI0023EAFA8A|nr:type IV secretion system protein [Pseudomonas protegens]MDF4211147.1 type IV secretion system protein [Pseudomonas protegens]